MSKWGVAVKKRKRLGFGIKLLLLAACILALSIIAESRFGPVIESEAIQQVSIVASSKMSAAINRQIAVYEDAGNYHSLMHIERDDQGKIVLMAADTLLINTLINALIIDINSSLRNLDEEELHIPLMVGTGSKMLSSWGPDVPVRITGIATPDINLTDSFVSAGINQVKHSIYLEVAAELRVAVPFSQDTCSVSTRVLLAEGIIIGDIPDTFVQFDTSNLR